MEPDEQGFLYPKVDHSNCINCGVCEKVCPVLHPNKEQKPLKLLAGRNQDIEVVMQSSFLTGTFLAAWVLLKNWDHLPITDLGLSLKGRAKDIFWGTFVALAIYTVGFGILYGLGEVEITAVHFSAYDFLLSWICLLYTSDAADD